MYLSTQAVRRARALQNKDEESSKLKRLAEYELRLATGTSAGSVNALIAAINSCRLDDQNDPLRLAVEIAASGLQVDASGLAGWTDLQSGDRDGSVEALTYQYLDPDIVSYSGASSEERAQRMLSYLEALRAGPRRIPSTLRSVRDLVGELLVTARAGKLHALAEEHPQPFREQVRVTHRNFPTISGLLGASLGFFEAKFREFDVHLGMYDAYAEIVRQLDPSGEKGAAEFDYVIRLLAQYRFRFHDGRARWQRSAISMAATKLSPSESCAAD